MTVSAVLLFGLLSSARIWGGKPLARADKVAALAVLRKSRRVKFAVGFILID
jgi:hypothetical protein